MAKKEDVADDPENGEEQQPPVKKKLSGKLIVMTAAAVILVLGLGLGGYVYFLGDHKEAAEDGAAGHGDADEHRTAASSLVFYELPAILVNLNTNDGSNKYLKLQVSVELASNADIAQIEPLMPRVIDRFQVYLRELRVSELTGSAGMFQLKQELLRRINLAVPVTVKDVLFTEMIIQ